MVPTMHKKVKRNGKSKKTFITIQVVTILVFAGALGGMLVFTQSLGGLMYEATIGGQKFKVELY